MARLRGSQSNDTLRGKGADDQIFGLGGGDILFGGAGNDQIDGGPGNDQIRGQGGADLLIGGAGDDSLFGAAGGDELRGGAGADRLLGGPGADVLIGARGEDRLTGGPGVDTLTGGPGADQFIFGAADQGVDQITDFNPAAGDTLSLTGALVGASVRMVDDGTDTTVRVRTADADSYTDLAVLEGHREPIDVWYGDHQQFGDPGEGQRWVNVLGTVATDGLSSLSYTLDGGAEQALAFGPFHPADPPDRNFTRLAGDGDFNVELDYHQLRPGAADDTVRIIARYDDGQVFTHDVTIGYEDGPAWPKNYSIDWAKVTDLQDVVQVVDGLWSFDADGVRPAVQGYDRLLAIGDASWNNYQVRLSIEMHDLHTVDPRGRDGGGILLGLHWNGHTTSPIGGDEAPHLGWIPSGAFVLTRGGAVLHPTEWFPAFNGNKNPLVSGLQALQEGHTYNVVYQTQRLTADTNPDDGLDRVYSLKIWEQGTPEPAGFLIHQIMVEQAKGGGIYLDAHYFDATFGDLTVKPLPPSNEVLPGQNSLAALLGDADPAPAATASAASVALAPEPAAMPQLSQLVAGIDDQAPAA